MVKALVFDFDGLLVNTEELIRRSYKGFFKRHGIKLGQELSARLMGRPILTNMKMLKEELGFAETPEELVAQRDEILLPLIDEELKLLKGAAELLDHARKWGLKSAIGSAGRAMIIDRALSKFNIEDYFDVIVTSEHLKGIGKPDPEVYLLVAEQLGVNPEECVVFEDAPNGVKAAKDAGMRVIFIPDKRFVNPVHESADLTLNNLGEVTHDVIRRLEK